jgi:excinuclease UvrABC nuclease subunit
VLTLDSQLHFEPARAKKFFAFLPESAAICLIEPKESSASPLFIRTQNLRSRLERLLGPVDPTTKRLNLRDFAKRIRYRLTASQFEQTLAYYQNAKQLFPSRYTEMLRMRPPAVLKVNLRNAYPRCYATRRISFDGDGQPTGGAYFGPFSSRKAADAFAERVLDLFKVRRCQIKIRRDPDFPGCIYSEMKMCLAPCFAGCSKEEYDGEVQQLLAFLQSNGDSLRTSLGIQRDRASEELDFEKAALLHKKVDKLDDALRGAPELPRQLQDLNAVILQRGLADQSIQVYEVRAGRIAEPFELSFSTMAGDPRSAEQILRQHLEPNSAASTTSVASQTAIPLLRISAPLAPDSVLQFPSFDSLSPLPSTVIPSEARNLSSSAAPTDNLSEHLWLLSRWFYSNPRAGEIFFQEKGWPYRKLMRACSRLLAPPEPPQTIPGHENSAAAKKESTPKTP